jgi:redox-sensitive bicupin YhaK (pirin superfamily)
MSFRITAPIPGRVHAHGHFTTNSFHLHTHGEATSPFIVLDEFRVRGRPFPPHPHAGFSAVTYVFEDSGSGLRVRDSLGNDVVVQPGGLVWTQAGQGVMHQEAASDPGHELHGAQIFINLSAQHKLLPAQTLWLDAPAVPQWSSGAGDRVRVLAGSFGQLTSALTPAEETTLLDISLRNGLELPCGPGCSAVLYVVSGEVRVSDSGIELASGQAAAFQGEGRISVHALSPDAHVFFMEGSSLRETLVINGPFIMNSQQQISEAVGRFQSGSFGDLAPLPDR